MSAEARRENNGRVHTHTHTHDRQLRSCGIAAATHAGSSGGCSPLNIKHTANVSGSAYSERHWKRGVIATMGLTHTYTSTRAAAARLQWRSVQRALRWLSTEYQTNGDRRRKRGVRSKREYAHARTRVATAKLRCGSGNTCWWLFNTEYQAYGERQRKRGMGTTMDLTRTYTTTRAAGATLRWRVVQTDLCCNEKYSEIQ